MAKISQERKLHLAILKQMATLTTSGFGLVAALAWNNVIQDLVNNYIKPYLPQGSGLMSLFLYAVLITTLAVLVPPSERLAEALLPSFARLTSSFRYGGMPSVPFYYQGSVEFYYDVDKFRALWESNHSFISLIAQDDAKLVPPNYKILVTTPTYLGIAREAK
ncbi:MAG: hypothetical protein UV55_C0026G0023 [Candidatus Gottesmanbacteria bacterium GW2011_GWC1_43_10]|nr:MAG: hypothetical protein UV55_C0026G0023 [Candidatus Gottesmanbacteria bacterium GW2011_GWC1_43_10]